MIYCASLDTTLLTLGTLTLTTAGKSDAVVTLGNASSATGNNGTILTHACAMSSFVSQGQRGAARFSEMSDQSLATALQVLCQAALTSSSWTSPGGFTVTWSKTTGKFTFAYTTANFTMAWSLADGRKFCGFSASQSGAATYTSDRVPTYVIAPTLDKASNDTTNYEPTGIASRATADDGTGFGIARYESPLRRDWVQEFETKEKSIRLSAASTHPWTFQDLFEHCRTVFPFIVVDGFNDDSYYECFTLREDGCVFNPDRATPGNDTQFHHSLKCHVEGRVAE